MTNAVRDKSPNRKAGSAPKRSFKERAVEILLRPQVLAAVVGGACTIIAAIISLLSECQ